MDKFVSWLQGRLAVHGLSAGAVDGVVGRMTISALRAFQKANGLPETGQADAQTVAALRSEPSAAHAGAMIAAPRNAREMAAPWYEWALSQKGVHERRNRSLVLSWLKAAASWVSDTNTAWCGAFVRMAIAETLPTEPLPTNALSARAWANFGRPLKAPAKGAVLVFWRGSRAGWQGHVGLYAGEDATTYHVLGGNQSDAVTVTRVRKDRLLAIRWPSTVLPPTSGRFSGSVAGAISENEA